MHGDSDDEINQLRNAALLSKPVNIRKRKVTLTNTRKVTTGTSDSYHREVVHTRQVVVGAKSGIPSRAVTVARTVDNGVEADSSPCTKKKARVENDQRIFSVSEEKESTLILDEKDVDEASWETGEDHVNLKADVRIVVSKNETIASTSFEAEPSPKVVTGDTEGELVEDDVDLESEEENDAIVDDERDEVEDEKGKEKWKEGEDDKEEEREDEKEEEGEENRGGDEHTELASSDKESLTFSDRLQTEEIADVIEDTKDGKDVGQKDVYDDDLKDDENKEGSKSTDKVSEGGDSNKQLDVKSETLTTNKEDTSVNEENTSGTSEQKDNSNEVDHSNDALSAAASDLDQSSGFDSDSSRSGSSSGSSSSSSGSSSGSASDTGSSSSSDSSSESENESGPGSRTRSRSRSRSRSKSRSKSVSSSSYSYSTGGSAEKKATLRSVVAQTNRISGQRGRPNPSPDGRRASRDRRYMGRPPSLDRSREETRDSERIRRGDESWNSRRRSPYRRRGESRSPERYSRRRGSNERRNGESRSREVANRPRQQARGRTRSNSPARDHALLSHPVDVTSPVDITNPLLRKGDDYTEIDVKKGLNIKQFKASKTGRLIEKKTNSEVTGPGFDLRSRLGPKVTEKENVAVKPSWERKRTGRKAVGRRLKASEGEVVQEGKSDKELKLDARIERIRIKNEEIRKRREEVEREKMLYA